MPTRLIYKKSVKNPDPSKYTQTNYYKGKRINYGKKTSRKTWVRRVTNSVAKHKITNLRSKSRRKSKH